MIFSGIQDFLDSLQKFHRDYPFDIKVGNVYIRGGTRSEDGKGKFRRPKMGANAIETLVLKSVNDIMRKQNLNDDDKLTSRLKDATLVPTNNETNCHPTKPCPDLSRCCNKSTSLPLRTRGHEQRRQLFLGTRLFTTDTATTPSSCRLLILLLLTTYYLAL